MQEKGKGADLAPGTNAKVLALDAVSELFPNGSEFRADGTGTFDLDSGSGCCLAIRGRLDDADEVGVGHEEVGLVAVDVDEDDFVRESEGDGEDSGGKGRFRGREDRKSVACNGVPSARLTRQNPAQRNAP